MGRARVLSVAGLAVALGGCALIANYDFGKWGQDLRDGGAGGTGGSGTASSSGSGTSTSTSSSTGVSTSSSTSSGACTNGSIAGQTAAVFTTVGVDVASVAVDSQFVFWTEGVSTADVARIARADKGPTSVKLQTQTGQVQPRSLVLDDTNAYWITATAPPGTGAALWQVPKSFAAAPTLIYSSNMGAYGGVAVASGVVYFTTTDGGTAAPSGGIFSIPLGGGAPQQLVSLPGQTVGEIAADGVSVYVVVVSSTSTGDILQLNRTTLTTTVLAKNEPGVRGLVVDGTYAYWSTTGGIHKAPTSGAGPVQSIGTTMMSPCGGMSIDGAYFYCTANNAASVLQIQLGAINPIASVPVTVSPMRGIAADCNTVYFAAGQQIDTVPR